MSSEYDDPGWDWIRAHPNRKEPRFPFADVGSPEDRDSDKASPEEKRALNESSKTYDIDLNKRLLIRPKDDPAA
jgi:hypothetical protein